MVEKIWEATLSWFAHVKRRCTDVPVPVRNERLAILDVRRGRCRRKKSWER